MWFVVGLVVLFLIVHFPGVRIAVFHPWSDLFWLDVDIMRCIKYKTYNCAPTGVMRCYSGLFGRGKTLSAVHEIRRLYKRYNGLPVWDERQKQFVKQNILILSNVHFNDVPYIPLTSLSEVVSEAYKNKNFDLQHKTRTVIYVLIDEASVQLNSRSFKQNISADFLNTLLTCRHYHMSMFYTSQRFNLTDKLLRDVTQEVVECKKLWRFQIQYTYDAWQLENSSRPDTVPSIKNGGWFVRDRDYKAYDTLATVDNLKKKVEEGDMLSDDEILTRRAGVIDYSAVIEDKGLKIPFIKKKR